MIIKKISEDFPLTSINIDQLASTITEGKGMIIDLFKCTSHKHLDMNMKELGLTRGSIIGTATDHHELMEIICNKFSDRMVLMVCGNKGQQIIPLILNNDNKIDKKVVIACVGLEFNKNSCNILHLNKVDIELPSSSQKLSPPKKQPTDFKDSCRCGENKKGEFQSCTDTTSETKYKSRCPCLVQQKACTDKCKCKKCGNKNGSRTYPPAGQTKTKRKPRKMTIRKNKIEKGVDYMRNNSISEKCGKWMDIELCIFYTVLKDDGIPSEQKDLFFFFVQDNCNRTCKLNLTRKEKHFNAKKTHAKNHGYIF